MALLPFLSLLDPYPLAAEDGGRAGMLAGICIRGSLILLLVLTPSSLGTLAGDLDLLFSGELLLVDMTETAAGMRGVLELVIPPLVDRLLPPLPRPCIDGPARSDDGRSNLAGVTNPSESGSDRRFPCIVCSLGSLAVPTAVGPPLCPYS